MISKGSDFAKAGEAGLARSDKTTADVLSAVYGSFVGMVIEDLGRNTTKANEELFKFGQSIGQRMADEVLAKFGLATNCTTFIDACEAVTKLGLRLYLGAVTETVANDSANRFVFKLIQSNVVEFLEPGEVHNCRYHNVIAGGVAGALTQLGWPVAARFSPDVSTGDSSNIFSLELMNDSK